MEHPLALNFLLESRWAMRREVLEQMLSIIRGQGSQEVAAELRAQREQKAAQRFAMLSDLAVPGFEGKVFAGGVAVIPFMGPHFPRANLFTRVSGAVSLEQFRAEFQKALDDPKVNSIILDVDSPGGNVTGTDETAQMVAAARGKKPVTAFISGLGASGAYWISSAAARIVMDETAEAGSVGVMAIYEDWSEADKKSGVQEISIVASQSPKKNMPPTTPEGRAEIQRIVDDLAQVMIERIAVNRGMNQRNAAKQLGEGAVFVAGQAVGMRLADGTSTFAELIRAESEKFSKRSFFMEDKTGDVVATLKEKHPEAYQAVYDLGVAAGKKAENERLAAIATIKKPGFEDFIAQHAKDPAMTKEKLAALILDEEEKRREAKKTAIAADAGAVKPAAEGQPLPTGPTAEEEARAKRAGETARSVYSGGKAAKKGA